MTSSIERNHPTRTPEVCAGPPAKKIQMAALNVCTVDAPESAASAEFLGNPFSK